MAERSPSLSTRFHGLIISDLVFTDVRLGRGADATVYAVEWNGTVCAAKRLHEILLEDQSPGGADKFISNFEAECLTWSKLRHPGVVQFLGVYLERNSRLPVLVMEKMDTTLRTYLEDHSKEEFPLHQKAFVLRQVTQALAYLHSQNPPLVHHDLSPNNVLLNMGSFVTKVSDFGMSRAINPSALSRKSSIKGTLAFMAPEALHTPPRYNEKLDVFSFGNIIISTVTHEWPNPGPPTQIQGDHLVALNELTRREHCIVKFTAHENQLLMPLVRCCLENRPDKRPSSVVLVQEMRRIEKSIVISGSSTEQQQQQQQQIAKSKDDAMALQLKVTESLMEKLCYVPFGIRELTVTSDGGTYSLGSSDASLKVPPGAVKKKSTIRYAIILNGPFALPTGYRAVSVVVYLNLSKTTLQQPIYLFLSDWCEKRYTREQYPLMFFRASHELKGEKMQYQFTPMPNADHQNGDILKIIEPKTLYAKVLKEGHEVHDLYCMMPIQKLDAAENCFRIRILFIWSSDSWRELLKQWYIEKKHWQMHPEITSCETFPMNNPVTAALSSEAGPGWSARLEGQYEVRREAITSGIAQFTLASQLQKAIEKEEFYPPALKCRVRFSLPETERTVQHQLTIALEGAPVTFSYDIMQAPAYSIGYSNPTSPNLSDSLSSGITVESLAISGTAQNLSQALSDASSGGGDGVTRSLSLPTAHSTSVITSGSRDILSQKPTMKDLYEKAVVRVASNWYKVGLQLDIEHYVLDAIKTPHGTNVDHCLGMFAQWLDGKRDCGKLPRTWSSVLEAVEISCGSEVRQEIITALNS